MIFQPAILALLLASGVSLAVIVAAVPSAVAIIRHWDLTNGSARQLALERRTYLLSTMVAFVLGVQAVSLLLYVFNADRMAVMFVGAMCAVGTLNVNAYGLPALVAAIAVFFAAAVWLALHHADIQAPDYPLVRVKFAWMLGLAPLLALAAVLEWRYFLALRADVVTSCCSRLFSTRVDGGPGDLAAWRPAPAMVGFFGSQAFAAATGAWAAWRRRGGVAVAISSLAAGVLGVAGIIAFVSAYVYEQPNHHCPFCLLKSDYGYVGYALYLPLFGATAAGLSAGAVQPFARVPSLAAIVPDLVARWSRWAAVGFVAVAVVATILILRSPLLLLTGATP